jgi:chemotaxis protein MotB
MKMLSIKNWILLASVSFAISSCSTVYKCGEAIPEKGVKGSKRLKAVVSERDSLCGDLASEKTLRSQYAENLERKTKEFDNLSNDHSDLRRRFDQLSNQNISQAEQFNAALKLKSDELKQKEALLQERELAIREMQRIISRQDSITRKLNEILRNALLGFNSDELSVEIKNGKVYVSMSNKLMFNSGSATVENKGKEALRVLAEVLNKNLDIDILIEGHTDNVPIRNAQFRDNWDLSVARATSIVRILTNDLSVSSTRVTASGKGEFSPRADNETAEGRALNRRTDIILSPKLDELLQLLGNN